MVVVGEEGRRGVEVEVEVADGETDGELHAGRVFHTGPVGGVGMGCRFPRQRVAHRCHRSALSLGGGASKGGGSAPHYQHHRVVTGDLPHPRESSC